MPFPLFLVDAFTDQPFRGNQAGVVILRAPRDEAWMQSVGAEMNVAETAFLKRRDDGSFDLRWFTPTVEVDLCGHATLGSAHALWESGEAPGGDGAPPLRFHTRSGLLTAARSEEGWIVLDFPATPPTPADAPPGLLEALGLPSSAALAVGRSRFDWLVEVASEAEVRGLAPDIALLKQVECRGAIVTAKADSTNRSVDFVSRFFAPAAGVDEDPVTGSAHCCLAPFWAAKLGKTEMIGYQASRRGGTVRVEVAGDRVRLSGRAVTVVRGQLEA
jgi:PhzF family phenazine biosynthesis protein